MQSVGDAITRLSKRLITGTVTSVSSRRQRRSPKARRLYSFFHWRAPHYWDSSARSLSTTTTAPTTTVETLRRTDQSKCGRAVGWVGGPPISCSAARPFAGRARARRTGPAAVRQSTREPRTLYAHDQPASASELVATLLVIGRDSAGRLETQFRLVRQPRRTWPEAVRRVLELAGREKVSGTAFVPLRSQFQRCRARAGSEEKEGERLRSVYCTMPRLLSVAVVPKATSIGCQGGDRMYGTAVWCTRVHVTPRHRSLAGLLQVGRIRVFGC